MTSKTNLLPVMVQTAYVKAQSGVRLDTMFDLASTDHYITHKKARKLGCRGVDVELIIEGIKGVEYSEQTRLYEVSLVEKYGSIQGGIIFFTSWEDYFQPPKLRPR